MIRSFVCVNEPGRAANLGPVAAFVAERRPTVVDIRDEELYEKHAEELIRFATTLVGPSYSEDVVANAVLRSMVARGWPTVTEPRAYLFRAVLNEARSLNRSDQRRTRHEQSVALVEFADADSISLEVRDAMAQLSLRERSVLYLAYWHGLTVTDIARTLHLSNRSTERALTTDGEQGRAS